MQSKRIYLCGFIFFTFLFLNLKGVSCRRLHSAELEMLLNQLPKKTASDTSTTDTTDISFSPPLNKKEQSTLARLIELGNKHPELLIPRIEELLTTYEPQRIIYILGNIQNPKLNERLIDILNTKEANAQLKEYIALALAQKSDQTSISALANFLGKERAYIYQKFGIWIIDIGVPSDYEFTTLEIQRIEQILERIPREHIQKGVKVILRRLPTDPEEEFLEYPEWMEEEFQDVWKPVPKGSYEYLNKIVNINETDQLERVLCHEVGHGLHYYVVTEDDLDSFLSLYRDSGGYIRGDFAYPYGMVTPKEDFATIYETLLIDPEFLNRPYITEILKEKIEIIKKYLP